MAKNKKQKQYMVEGIITDDNGRLIVNLKMNQ